MKHHTWSLLAVAATLLAPCPAMAAFKCPASNATTGEKPKLSADDVADVEGTVSATLMSTVHRMQAEGVKSGEIVDRLVMAYCSRIAPEPNVSDAYKAGQIRHFASKIANVVYTASGQTEEDIVLNVPVPTPVYNQLKQAAKSAGLSEDTWVNQAILTHLAK